MLKKLILSGILGGIVLFIWGYVSWMILPWHNTTMQSFKDNAAVTQVIQANTSGSGIYTIPSEKDKQQALAKTPLIFTSVYQPGASSMTQAIIISFITQVVAAFLVSWLVMKTTLGYFGRVGFVIIFALAAAIVTLIPAWNWWRFDLNYTLVMIADLLVGWFLAGLVIAGIVRTPRRRY